MRNGYCTLYDKLNEKGYVPEETPVTNGDVLFGKVTPITDNNTGKVFKDSSEQLGVCAGVTALTIMWTVLLFGLSGKKK